MKGPRTIWIRLMPLTAALAAGTVLAAEPITDAQFTAQLGLVRARPEAAPVPAIGVAAVVRSPQPPSGEGAAAPTLWKDPSGLTWSAMTAAPVTRSGAQAYCRDQGLALPSFRDFERAESGGLRDSLPGVRVYGRGFWSSTEAYFNTAYVYNGYTGEIGLISVELVFARALNTAWGICVDEDRGAPRRRPQPTEVSQAGPSMLNPCVLRREEKGECVYKCRDGGELRRPVQLPRPGDENPVACPQIVFPFP